MLFLWNWLIFWYHFQWRNLQFWLRLDYLLKYLSRISFLNKFWLSKIIEQSLKFFILSKTFVLDWIVNFFTGFFSFSEKFSCFCSKAGFHFKTWIVAFYEWTEILAIPGSWIWSLWMSWTLLTVRNSTMIRIIIKWLRLIFVFFSRFLD